MSAGTSPVSVGHEASSDRRSSPYRDGGSTQRNDRAALPQPDGIVQVARHPDGERQRTGELEQRHTDDRIAHAEEPTQLRVITQQSREALRMDQAPAPEGEGAQRKQCHRGVYESHMQSVGAGVTMRWGARASTAAPAAPTNRVESPTARTKRGDPGAPRKSSQRAANAIAATRSGTLARLYEIRSSQIEAEKFVAT